MMILFCLAEKRKGALVATPSRKILNDIEKSRRVEKSGEFVVGSDTDPDVADVIRDPFGLETAAAGLDSTNIRTSFTQWLKRQRFIQKAVKKVKDGGTDPSRVAGAATRRRHQANLLEVDEGPKVRQT